MLIMSYFDTSANKFMLTRYAMDDVLYHPPVFDAIMNAINSTAAMDPKDAMDLIMSMTGSNDSKESKDAADSNDAVDEFMVSPEVVGGMLSLPKRTTTDSWQ